MNKKTYVAAVFFIALVIVAALFRALLQVQYQEQIPLRQSYPQWMIVTFLVNLILLVILLKYFWHKKYWLAFFTVAIVIIGLTGQLITGLYFITTRRNPDIYRLMQIIYSVFFAIHSISLVLSKAREKFLLRLAGISGLFTQIIMWIFLLIYVDRTNLVLFLKMANFSYWIILVNVLPLTILAFNFINEIQLLKADHHDITWDNREKYTLGLLGALFFLPVTISGLKLANQKDLFSGREPKESEIAAAHFYAPRHYVSHNGDTMRYRLMKPLDYDPQKKYPIVVCLHHGEGWGTDNVKQVEASRFAGIMEGYDNRKKYPVFLFVPQCPPGNSWGNLPGYPDMDELLFETLASLEKEFSIDSNRRYVTGVSLGGLGTWHLLCARPKMFAAGISISGGGDHRFAKDIVTIPVWAFHGTNDKNVPEQWDRDMISALKKEGGHPKYTEYPGKGHNVSWEDAMREPGLLDWLFAQKRH